MATKESIALKLRNLIDAGNTTTGKTDENLTAVFGSLIEGYEQRDDTSDATATEKHILEGETAYVGGVKITGTIPTYKGEPLASLTTYTTEDNESGGQTYTISASCYVSEKDAAGVTTYTIGG